MRQGGVFSSWRRDRIGRWAGASFLPGPRGLIRRIATPAALGKSVLFGQTAAHSLHSALARRRIHMVHSFGSMHYEREARPPLSPLTYFNSRMISQTGMTMTAPSRKY
jgi:hypothetical protein